MIEEIKEKLDIVDLIGQYIQLKKAGANYRAVCPFHNEKTPSFFVSPVRQMWHCFGCSAGGDHFGFVMKYENVDFPEALKILAEKAGVELRREAPEVATERNFIFDINKVAAQHFAGNLTSDAAAYLEKRGLSRQTITEFQIGFAPERDNLLETLRGLGLKQDVVAKSGLFYSDGYSLKPRFRSRIMFPIRDRLSRVVGFTGRVFPEERDTTEGKYVNTPETLAFKKSELLYGLDKALPFIKESQEVILTEGQMDFLMAWEKGVRNIVAVSSANLSAEQIRLLKRFAHAFVMAFDNDDAGVRCSLKSAQSLLRLGLEVFWLEFGGKDLGDWFLAHADAPKADFIESYYKRLTARYDVTKLSERGKFLKEFLPVVKSAQSGVTKDYWVKKTAEDLRLNESIVWEEVAKAETQGIAVEDKPVPAAAGATAQDRYENLFMVLSALIALHRKADLLAGLKDELKPGYQARFAVVERYLVENRDSDEVALLLLRGEYEMSHIEDVQKEFDILLREFRKEFYRFKITELERALKEHSDDAELLTTLSQYTEKLKSFL